MPSLSPFLIVWLVTASGVVCQPCNARVTSHYKVDVTLEPDDGHYLVILGISAIVFGNDVVVVFVGTVANFTDSELSRA